MRTIRAAFQSALLGFPIWFSVSLPGATAPDTVVIEAGSFERSNVIVTFSVPADRLAAGSNAVALARLVDGKVVRKYPVQFNPNGQAVTMIDHLAKGSRQQFQLNFGPSDPSTPPAADALLPSPERLVFERNGTRLDLVRVSQGASSAGVDAVRRHPLFSYQAEPGELPRPDIKESFRRGGYLHPIHAPGGQVVTDDFPPNHIHHHGVWSAWTKTEFQGRQPDFWNVGDSKGRVEFEKLDEFWDGPVHAGFRAHHRFVDLTAKSPVTALHETWTVTAYGAKADGGGAWMFDLVLEQRCATADALRLPEYRYGGIGLRGNRAWNGPTNAQFLTANGESDRVKGHATRARWCDLSGLVDGRHVGLAILGHPSNFRFPEPMRLHPDEPFFNYAPQQAGNMEIKPGDRHVSRYRFVVHDGPPDAVNLERLWNDFAWPPTVTVKAGR